MGLRVYPKLFQYGNFFIPTYGVLVALAFLAGLWVTLKLARRTEDASTYVEFGVTVSLVIGSVPAVFVGSLVSSSAPDRFVRPAITFVIFASGLKYVGVATTALGWILCAVLLAGGAAWFAITRPLGRS